jgi:hypothetical protein
MFDVGMIGLLRRRPHRASIIAVCTRPPSASRSRIRPGSLGEYLIAMLWSQCHRGKELTVKIGAHPGMKDVRHAVQEHNLTLA